MPSDGVKPVSLMSGPVKKIAGHGWAGAKKVAEMAKLIPLNFDPATMDRESSMIKNYGAQFLGHEFKPALMFLDPFINGVKQTAMDIKNRKPLGGSGGATSNQVDALRDILIQQGIGGGGGGIRL